MELHDPLHVVRPNRTEVDPPAVDEEGIDLPGNRVPARYAGGTRSTARRTHNRPPQFSWMVSQRRTRSKVPARSDPAWAAGDLLAGARPAMVRGRLTARR